VRLAHVEQGDTWEHVKQRLALLVLTAQSWGENTIIPNYENEAETFSPSLLTDHLYGVMDWDGDTGWSTQAWLPNDVDYTPFRVQDPALLQIFPKDLRWEPWQIQSKMGDCVWHAREKGFRYVGVTYQTYGEAVPSWYDCESHMHSTFPGNLIAHGQWGEWYR